MSSKPKATAVRLLHAVVVMEGKDEQRRQRALEAGTTVTLPADVATDLVAAGAAAPVQDPGDLLQVTAES
ncbi:hypothetical protein [Methylibium rhizosphaerae]|uniref:hypothetical protein n=1 Tax=Methylibium rhizosphaerae TaxID=2570323 RepID=UPI00112790B7|nr:hypothetical protein [Methylibium rhizosphaerae]